MLFSYEHHFQLITRGKFHFLVFGGESEVLLIGRPSSSRRPKNSIPLVFRASILLFGVDVMKRSKAHHLICSHSSDLQISALVGSKTCRNYCQFGLCYKVCIRPTPSFVYPKSDTLRQAKAELSSDKIRVLVAQGNLHFAFKRDRKGRNGNKSEDEKS